MNSFCRESVILGLHWKMIFYARVGLVVVCPGCWHYSIPGTALILLPSLCWLHPMAASTYLHNIYTLYIYYLHIYSGLPPGMLGVHPMAASVPGLPPNLPPGLPPLPPHLLAAQASSTGCLGNTGCYGDDGNRAMFRGYTAWFRANPSSLPTTPDTSRDSAQA